MEQNNMNNNNSKNLIVAVLAVLLLVAVGVIAYLLGAKTDGSSSNSEVRELREKLEAMEAKEALATGEGVEVVVVEDERCLDCNVDELITQMEVLPALENAEFTREQYNDDYAKLMEENNIKTLPFLIFNTNEIADAGMKQYLIKLKDSEDYYLNVGGEFNPNAKMSEKGLKIADKELIQKMKDWSYVEGNENAKITWFEFSDIQCPFCAKLHTDDTPKKVKDEYGDKINMYLQHFPLDSIHPLANKGAQALECIAQLSDSNTMYTLLEESYSKYGNNNFTMEGFYDLVEDKGLDVEAIKSCVDSGKYTDKVKEIQNNGLENFGISSTPGNLLVNNETGEYIVISGAYPFDQFKEKIDILLN